MIELKQKSNSGVGEKPPSLGAVQNCLGARRSKTESQGGYKNTLSGSVCRATQQISVFEQSQQPVITCRTSYPAVGVPVPLRPSEASSHR